MVRFLEIRADDPIKVMTAITTSMFAAGFNSGGVIVYRIEVRGDFRTHGGPARLCGGGGRRRASRTGRTPH